MVPHWSLHPIVFEHRKITLADPYPEARVAVASAIDLLLGAVLHAVVALALAAHAAGDPCESGQGLGRSALTPGLRDLVLIPDHPASVMPVLYVSR